MKIGKDIKRIMLRARVNALQRFLQDAAAHTLRIRKELSDAKAKLEDLED